MTGRTANLHPDLVAKLTDLEKLVGQPLDITSGYRDPDHNTDVGGVPNSEHTYDPAQAVDIACTNGSHRWALITNALKAGFVRLGIGKTFVHVGIATDKPQRVIWHYY
jgi:uncharacterized protein YcbK (DUF882 family)